MNHNFQKQKASKLSGNAFKQKWFYFRSKKPLKKVLIKSEKTCQKQFFLNFCIL